MAKTEETKHIGCDFGGAIDCPHCGTFSTLRKNEAGIFYLEKIISNKKCPECRGFGWISRWFPMFMANTRMFMRCPRCKGTGVIRE